MKDIKFIAVVVVLCLAIVFLVMDKCGSSSKLDELKGEYKEANEIAKVEKMIKEEIIKKQNEIIEKQDSLIAEASKKAEIKNSHISRLGSTITDLEDEFDTLEQQDAKIGNLMQQVEAWKEKFSLAQGIIADKDEIIFSLNEKYNAQLIISDSYKSLYETLQVNTKKLEKIVTVQDWQIKKYKLTGGLKTGIVLGLAGLVAYGVLK